MTDIRISELLNNLDLSGPFRQEDYVQQLRERFGARGEAFLQFVDDCTRQGFTPERWQQMYRLQHQDPAMAHWVTAHCNSAIYRAVLDWLCAQAISPPPRFTELGANSGLLTLALARLWPEAQGLGVDNIAEAVSVAEQLRSDFAVENVAFRQADLCQLQSCDALPAAPVVLAPFFFHELMEADDRSWAICMKNIHQLLEPGGILITINRFPRGKVEPMQQMQRLMFWMEKAGLSAVHRAAINLEVEQFPVIIFR